MAIVIDKNTNSIPSKEWDELLEHHRIVVELPDGRMIQIRG